MSPFWGDLALQEMGEAQWWFAKFHGFILLMVLSIWPFSGHVWPVVFGVFGCINDMTFFARATEVNSRRCIQKKKLVGECLKCMQSGFWMHLQYAHRVRVVASWYTLYMLYHMHIVSLYAHIANRLTAQQICPRPPCPIRRRNPATVSTKCMVPLVFDMS